MNAAALAWFSVALLVVYAVAVDGNVFTALVLLSRGFQAWLIRQWFRIRHNPDSPLSRLEVELNKDVMARELRKHFSLDDNDRPGSSD